MTTTKRQMAERRATLVASAEPTGYRFDVVLQGPDETVFLAHSPAPAAPTRPAPAPPTG